MPDRRARWLVLAVVLAGGIVRLLAHLQLRELPWWTVHDVDSLVYHRLGQAIAAGEPLGPDALRVGGPGYGHFVGAVYALFGEGPWAFRLVHSALGLLTIVLVWDTARRVLRDARWALVPATLAAFYGPFVFYEGVLLASTLALFLVTLLAWAVARIHDAPAPRLAPWAAVGFLWGLTTVVRPNALLLAIPLLWIALRNVRGPDTTKSRWIRAVLVVGCGALAVLPFSLRSSAVAGEPVALTANAGLNLFIGNGPNASGTFRVPPEVPGSGTPAEQLQAFHETAERETGRELSAGEADAYWRDRALAAIAEDPLGWLAVMAKKTRLFFNGRELSNVFDYEFARHVSPVLRAPLVQFAWIVPFGVLGIVLLLVPRQRAPPPARALAGMALAFAAGVIAVFVVARYRLPVVPLLLIAATFAVRELARAVAERRWGRLGGLGGALAAAVVLAWPVPVTKHWEREWFDLAIAWHEQGELSEAERAYRASLEHEPAYVPSRNNLALLYERQGRAADAAAQWRAVARIARREGRQADLERAREHLERLEGAEQAPPAPR